MRKSVIQKFSKFRFFAENLFSEKNCSSYLNKLVILSCFFGALEGFFAGIWKGACSWTSICAPAFSSSIWREKKCSISDWKWNIKKERIFECHPTQPGNFPNLGRFWNFLSPKKRPKFGTWLYQNLKVTTIAVCQSRGQMDFFLYGFVY